MDTLERLEIANATVFVTDDGLSAILSLGTTQPNPRHIQAMMPRDLLERLCLLAARELKRQPKPARGQS